MNDSENGYVCMVVVTVNTMRQPLNIIENMCCHWQNRTTKQFNKNQSINFRGFLFLSLPLSFCRHILCPMLLLLLILRFLVSSVSSITVLFDGFIYVFPVKYVEQYIYFVLIMPTVFFVCVCHDVFIPIHPIPMSEIFFLYSIFCRSSLFFIASFLIFVMVSMLFFFNFGIYH